MFRRIFCGLLLFALLIAVTSSTSSAKPLAKNSKTRPFKVGAILPLSGEAASIGESVKNGILLAYNKLSDAERKKLLIYFEDDALSPAKTVSAFNKLLGAQQIDAVITVASGSSNAVAPLAERQKIPMIAIATDPKVVANRNWVVNFWVTPEMEAKVALQEFKKQGYKKLARITTQAEGSISANDVFDKLNTGIVELTIDEQFPPQVKDFRTIIAKINSSKDIDAVSVLLFPGQLAVFAKQLRQLGSKLPMFGWEMFEDSNEVKQAQGAMEGARYVNADDSTGAFVEEYTKAYPKASLFGAANGHDAILLVSKALKQGQSKEGVNKFLHKFKNFSGALGKYSASGDNRFTLPAAVKVIKGEKFERAE